jgi:hypothetical protein
MTEFVQRPSLVIEPDVMREANETQSFSLALPDTGVKNGRNKNGLTATWTELLNIITSDIGVVPAGVNGKGDPTPERVYIDVKFNVAPETLDPKNVGRSLKQRYLINPVAMHDKQSKDRIMSLMSIGKLNALLRAAGFEIEPGVATDFNQYFEPNAGDESQVSGLKVWADFRNYVDRDGTDRQDIVAYDTISEE